jgi:hypothetical protein
MQVALDSENRLIQRLAKEFQAIGDRSTLFYLVQDLIDDKE